MCQAAILLLLAHAAHAQINVEFQIQSANQTIQQASLNNQLEQQNLSTATVIASEMGEVVLIQQCTKGTYAEGGTSTCANCPAGTASPFVGATSSTTCQTCFAGTFAPTRSSACTACPASMFSTTVGAPSALSCTYCPPNSNSTAASDAITSCACDDKYFNPVNVLTKIDPPAPVQFSSWQALAVGTLLLDVPHLGC